MMSGNMLNPWAFEADVVRCTYELLKKLNIRNSSYAIDELKAVDAYDLIPPLLSYDLTIDFFGSLQFCFIPTVDGEFIKQSPHILFHQKPASNVPIIIGLTSLESEWDMSFEIRNTKYPNGNLSISKLIKNFMSHYFEHDHDTIKNKVFKQNFQREADMNYGIYKFIQQYINITKQEKVFLYRFAFDGKFGKFKENTGAAHGDDLAYLFKDVLQENSTQYDTTNLTSEILIKEKMVTMWSNFIKFE